VQKERLVRLNVALTTRNVSSLKHANKQRMLRFSSPINIYC
jgi:hypothetical protein